MRNKCYLCVCFLPLFGSVNREGDNHRVIMIECRYHIPKNLSSLHTKKCEQKREEKQQRCILYCLL